ncbi:Maf family protein [Alkalihalobacillus hemicellulosilyticus]|uniref:dTTP/UTP pyrophosphatase n=1 Tax=Halalkalibacter hemicellulosilyticusJCM 9152 TaxID=1236971 RepID=W4QE31_9BACI|nr:Maf family protein [Halalkalibacter hemicellulosilyticus]GAE30212.1 septum formation protein Maf [Halalkalibacter hemicellulosilyticusJCM 9152]
MKPFILASRSPRRQELLEQMKLSFIVEASEKEEKVVEPLPPQEFVMQLAKQKAEDVWRRYKKEVVLGADTIVSNRGSILGKPTSAEDAKRMLTQLSGITHQVYTGVSIYSPDKVKTFFDKTDVTFYPLTRNEIEWYIKSGEPFDKAGAYGIQGLGAYFVQRIEGDYYTVMGLPLAKTIRALQSFSITPS